MTATTPEYSPAPWSYEYSPYRSRRGEDGIEEGTSEESQVGRVVREPGPLLEQGEEATREFAESVWNQVNLVNLRENIVPTRGRAHLVLEKDREHAIRRVRLRKL